MLRFVRSLFGGAATTAQTSQADAQNALVAAILELRAIVTSGNPEQITTAIEAFNAKAIAGDLVVREREHEVAKAERMLAVLTYTDRLQRGEGVQAMAVMPDGEPAYFRASVSRETNRDDDDDGQLDIAAKGIFYDGDKRLTMVWNKILTIGIDRSALIVHPTRGGTPQTFYIGSEREAFLAHAVASTIFTQHTTTAAPVKRRKSPAPESVMSSQEHDLLAFDIGSTTGACNFNIVGESHYQGRLRNVLASGGRSLTVTLIPEPTNAFDPNAIRVVAEGSDTVGYLSKEDAVYYAPVFALLGRHNRVGSCRAQLTGGAGEKRSFGVLLNLRDVDELLRSIRDTLEPGTIADDQPF